MVYKGVKFKTKIIGRKVPNDERLDRLKYWCKLFHDKGIVLIINIEDKELRFDADISNHGHFKCTKCGKIYDFELNEKNLFLPNLSEFTINEQHIYLKGVCPNCINK